MITRHRGYHGLRVGRKRFARHAMNAAKTRNELGELYRNDILKSGRRQATTGHRDEESGIQLDISNES